MYFRYYERMASDRREIWCEGSFCVVLSEHEGAFSNQGGPGVRIARVVEV